MIRHFARNTAGRDFIVGDIHGCFSRLQAHLDSIGFDPARDRLFSVGDLVDRGPESEEAVDWLAKPWFHAVRGNHEQMAIDAAQGMYDPRIYAANGGQWFMDLPTADQQYFADAFAKLPIAIELETAAGPVGIVHANCPSDDWAKLARALSGDDVPGVEMACMWDRSRIHDGRHETVAGVRAVVVGHTPLQRPETLGNVYFIDTGAVFAGRDFTILDAATLQVVAPAGRGLDFAA